MKWQDKLTAKEHKHLKEIGVRTVREMRENRRGQLELQAAVPGAKEVCWDCLWIARKLGID